MPFAPALWFLPCLFISSVLYELISKLFNKFLFKSLVVVGIGVLGIVFSGLSARMLPFTLEPVCTGVLFMLIGELLKLKGERVFNYFYSHSIAIFVFWIISVVLAFVNPCVDMRSARYCIGPLYVLNGILGTLAYWFIAYKVSEYTYNKIINTGINGLSFLSKNAMVFLASNQFVINILENVLPSCSSLVILIIKQLIVFVLSMLIIMGMFIALNRANMWMFLGQKSQKSMVLFN